jgi:hypothetical protein
MPGKFTGDAGDSDDVGKIRVWAPSSDGLVMTWRHGYGMLMHEAHRG